MFHVLSIPFRWLGREIEITARMMVNNVLVSVCGTQLTLGVALKNGLAGSDILRVYLISWMLSFLYTYTFDAGNQAKGGTEDAHNKPWRPVPAGLVTERGLRVRYILANILYAYLGWRFGVLPWVLFWQATMIALNTFQGRWYFLSKQITMQLGVVALFAIAWGVVEPINTLAWQWILFSGILFVFPLIMEDLKDIEGDRVVGRRTLIDIFGQWPVRIWSASWTFTLPFFQHFGLYVPSGADVLNIAICDVLVTGSCWTVAYRLLRYRTPRQDAATYIMFYGAFLLALSASCILYL
ncbi:hypothetical protein BJP40_23880 [Streptomyces sp. CC53]|nr:hypothetical protein BJP40_23880 [Streptomyces sp. CC53]